MADNPSSVPPKVRPPLPSSGRAGQFKAPTTKLPPVQKAAATGKVVVMLSSVAKTAPARTQELTPALPSPAGPPPTAASVPPSQSPPAATPPQPALVTSLQAAPPSSAPTPRGPPPLPPRSTVSTPSVLPPQARLTSTTHVKLPPKTAAPALVSLSGKPSSSKTTDKVAPPLLPSKRSGPITPAPETKSPSAPPLGGAAVPGKSELKKTGPIVLNPVPPLSSRAEARKPGVIKLNSPSTEELAPDESIFPPSEAEAGSGSKPAGAPQAAAKTPAPTHPEGWKRLQPGDLPDLPESIDLFAHSQRLERKPVPIIPVGASKAQPPASLPSGADAKPGPALNPAPVALPHSKPAEDSAILHVAPPMTSKAHEEHREKLAQPHLPEPVIVPGPAPLTKAPALVATDPAAVRTPLPPPLPGGAHGEKRADTSPAKVAPQLKSLPPLPPEGKPALKQAMLPKRSVPSAEDRISDSGPVAAREVPAPVSKSIPVVVDIPDAATAKAGPAEKSDLTVIPKKAPEAKDVSVPGPEPKVETGTAKSIVAAAAVAGLAIGETKKPLVSPGGEPQSTLKPRDKKPASVAPAPAAAGTTAAVKAPQPAPARPATRAERAKVRRLRAVLFFWLLLLPAAAAGLFVGILHFGRDTRVEGQVIPPQGMGVNDEVWIVSNFSELASGVADDLAKDRVPLEQQIQERRDHVQRAQADIASREERIRLIQAEIQGTKDEINGLVKKSRDDTQALWDGEGAQIDAEYQSHLDSLQRTMAQRAASLKLPYQPDPTYPSPEVWANAYRLALYQVPPGVDGVKEHQWVGDQLKQWRDFQKSLDDRKEQLREKAAQLKLEPAPKIADLNSKIDDLNQRIQGTQAEEEPIKLELQQAQAELAQAQAADANLDEKYYRQLDALPAESVSFKIPLKPNGRFTWVPDNPFSEGELVHKYLIFSRAIRADGRQYWALHHFAVARNKTVELSIEPGGYVSTKAILRPNLSPDEQEQ